MADGLTKSIVVGIRLDPFFQEEGSQLYSHADEADRVLKAAKALALKTSSSLHLVSVLEEGSIDVTSAAPWLPQYRWHDLRMDKIVQSARAAANANLQKQLSTLASTVGGACPVTTTLITARYAAVGLVSEAISAQASMILLGSGVKADSYFTRGYSTPLTVMAEASVPVLVIGQSCSIDFSKDRLRILIADDLREQTASGMATALDWASVLGGADVLHMHIEELNEQEMRRILNQTVHELRSTTDHEKLAEDLIQALDSAFRERLRQRIQGAEERLQKSGGTFRFELRRCGMVRDELERAADEFHADIIVFGRHQKVYRRPFLVGRVTYQAMLSQKRGVMVIP